MNEKRGCLIRRRSLFCFSLHIMYFVIWVRSNGRLPSSHTHPKTKSGYQQTYSVYQAKNCSNCPLRGACHKSKTARQIQINWNLRRLREKARQNLLSDQGVAHRSQRPVDVEAVFGNIKQNKNFTRFMLRGKDNVLIEAGLIALAHNLAKMGRN